MITGRARGPPFLRAAHGETAEEGGDRMSRPDQDDWTAFVARHATGGVLNGRVTRVMPFGAFVAVAMRPRPNVEKSP